MVCRPASWPSAMLTVTRRSRMHGTPHAVGVDGDALERHGSMHVPLTGQRRALAGASATRANDNP